MNKQEKRVAAMTCFVLGLSSDQRDMVEYRQNLSEKFLESLSSSQTQLLNASRLFEYKNVGKTINNLLRQI